MLPEGSVLLALAESIADGSTIDWEVTENAANASERAVIRELRILSALAGLHRSMPVPEAPAPARVPRRGEAPAIGSWAHLTLVARLGGGASGEVYRAWDRDLEREVALKLLRGDASDGDLNASQIAREGRLLARVHHPNVITVHGVAVHDRRVGLWMELVNGVTLEQHLSHGRLSAREAALVGIDLCRALAAIHAAGLIHRDVKAQNVMREEGGRIVLMDLGTGREVHPADPGEVPDLAGTPLYLAPEIFRGEPAGERTDLYSLGVLLYHLVTGSYPVRAATVQALHEQHKKGLGVRLRDARADLPTAFVRVVDRAIAHDPAKRYDTAGALEAELAAALDTSVVLPAQDGRASAWLASRFRIAVAAAMLILVAGFAAMPWFRSSRAPGVSTAKVKLAVLPLRNLAGTSASAEWPQLIQTLFVEEIAGVQNVAIVDPMSLNTLLAQVVRASSATAPPQVLEALRRAHVSLAIDGTIRQAGGGYDLQINLVDVVSGETRFPAHVTATDENSLSGAVRSLADGVLGFIQLQVLQLANDRDLRPWMSFRRQNIQAVNAFLQASQHVYRNERAAGIRYLQRAIELDPNFIVPRVWLIPGLVSQKRMDEARASYAHLLTLEPTASPFEQAMIGFAGATLTGDLSKEVKQLEIALDYLPGNNILLVNLAESRALLGDFAGALDAMRPSVEMRWPFPPLYSLWGWCAVEAGRLDEARRVLREATSDRIVDPNVFGMLEALAIADGDAAVARREHRLYLDRMRPLDMATDSAELASTYASLARRADANSQPERAAQLRTRASEIGQGR